MKGKKITIISGGRLRRVSDDNKSLLDKKIGEGALVDRDMVAKVLQVVESSDKKATAYVVELVVEGKTLLGWVYSFEIAPCVTIIGD